MEKVPVQIKASHLSYLQIWVTRLNDPSHPHLLEKAELPQGAAPSGLPAREWWHSYHSSEEMHEKKEQLQVFQGSSQHWCSPSLQEDLKEKKSQKTAYFSAILHFLLQDRSRKKDFSLPVAHKYRTFITYFFFCFFCSTSEVLAPSTLGSKRKWELVTALNCPSPPLHRAGTHPKDRWCSLSQ